MIRSFYIASSRDGLTDVLSIAAYLESCGMRDAFPWPSHFSHRCVFELCGIRDRQHLAERELEAASSCDLFVGVARLGKGTHVELGAALAPGSAPKRIILVGVDPEDSVFYGARGVEVVATVPDVFRAVLGARVA